MNFDVIVVGSGPGGYSCALDCAKAGLKVAIIERDKIGGVCVNYGCIPTKSLIEQSHIIENLKNGKKYGIEVDFKNFNYSKIVKKSESASKKISKSIETQLKKSGVEIIFNSVKVVKNGSVIVESGEEYFAKNIVLATGAKPATTSEIEIDHTNILDSNDILKLKELPQSLAIVGGGAIGIEFASIFAKLGVKVYIFEAGEHIAPFATKRASDELKRVFRRDKIEVYEKTVINIKKVENGKVELFDNSDNSYLVDKVLVSVGRVANVNFEIKDIFVDYDERGNIIVDDNYKISDNIFVIGDLLNSPKFAHVAYYHSLKVSNYILNRDNLNISKFIPWAIFSYPEVAGFGDVYGEPKLILPIKVAGKSTAIEKDDGYIAIFVNEKNKIIGCEIVGYGASEILHEVLLVAENELDYKKMGTMIHIHPTISELNRELFLEM